MSKRKQASNGGGGGGAGGGGDGPPGKAAKTEGLYEPESILFTGGCGFIGSTVMEYIMMRHPNAKLVCLDSLEPCANYKNCEHLEANPLWTFVQGSITSADLVNHIFKSHRIDTVMHFAAQTHVDNSFGNSIAFTHANVLGTHVLLEAAKHADPPIRRFIHVSTDEVYGESAHGADTERNTITAALNPTNPYSATKVAAEFLVKAYRTSFNLPTIITRGNNVYGRKQFPEKLIPKFITLLSRGKPCSLHGDGSNARSFLHVDDVAKAFDTILTKGKVSTVYNIGSSEELTNKAVLDCLLDMFDIKGKQREKYITYVRDRAFNDTRYHIDTAALEALGWKQEIMFAEGLEKTVGWYTRHGASWWDQNALSSALQPHPVFKNNLGHAR